MEDFFQILWSSQNIRTLTHDASINKELQNMRNDLTSLIAPLTYSTIVATLGYALILQLTRLTGLFQNL